MTRSEFASVSISGRVLFFAAVLFPASAAAFPPNPEALMPKQPVLHAQPADFATKDEAEAFLVKALPLATAANPKYRSKDGALTQWLSKQIVFGPGSSANGISVAMKEDILEFRDGKQTSTGTHDVHFLIEDVQISELTSSEDVTENGEKALGVIFRCNSGKCIDAKWSGVSVPSDWSDISIQDNEMRSRVLAAFQALKVKAGDRKKPD